jgi:hypothetical protein
MRWTSWRRAVAALALILGIGVGASTVPASADPGTHAENSKSANLLDYWW